jgi:hypothetical protein
MAIGLSLGERARKIDAKDASVGAKPIYNIFGYLRVLGITFETARQF